VADVRPSAEVVARVAVAAVDAVEADVAEAVAAANTYRRKLETYDFGR
jgi:hypothetical protein